MRSYEEGSNLGELVTLSEETPGSCSLCHMHTLREDHVSAVRWHASARHEERPRNNTYLTDALTWDWEKEMPALYVLKSRMFCRK